MAASRGPKAEALGVIGAWRRFIEKVHQVVVEETGEDLRHQFVGQSAPTPSPSTGRRIFGAIFAGMPLDGLVLQNNHCEHDFYLISPFNDNFGVGGHPQGASCSKSSANTKDMATSPSTSDRASPRSSLVASAWARPRPPKPGCGGAGISSTRSAGHAGTSTPGRAPAGNPGETPGEWARDYNRVEFGPGGAELLADALMMTQELAARTFYMPGFSGAKRDAYAITHRLCFTDGRHYYRVIQDPHEAGYRENHLRGQVPRLMAGAEATRELSEAMLARAQTAAAAMSSVDQARAVLDSFSHLDDLVHLLTHYQQALMLWYYKDEPGLAEPAAVEARQQCATHARRALDLYAAYRQLWGLYKDAGMVPPPAPLSQNSRCRTAPRHRPARDLHPPVDRRRPHRRWRLGGTPGPIPSLN